MKLNFLDRSNSNIDRLVQISWTASESHENEILLIPERDEEELVSLINDKIENIEEDPEHSNKPTPTIPSLDLSNFDAKTKPIPKTTKMPSVKRLLIAVDSGIVHLGEFVNGGIACAIRGAAVCLAENQMLVLRYNTGPLLIDEHNQLELFRFMGKRLGNEKLYLTEDSDGNLVINPTVLGNANQIQDRFRNFVERMIQEEALGILIGNQRGLLMFDGALPAGTYDTPVSYMRAMLKEAVENRVDVIAISKKTKLRVNNKPLNALLDDDPSFIGFIPLKKVIEKEREHLTRQGLARGISSVSLGNEIYAVRFGLGPPAITFRVDVKNSLRSSPASVLVDTLNQCQIQGCYPRPLIDAHQYSSFLFQDVQLMTADLVARTGATPKEEQSMEWMFEPFGSFGK